VEAEAREGGREGSLLRLRLFCGEGEAAKEEVKEKTGWEEEAEEDEGTWVSMACRGRRQEGLGNLLRRSLPTTCPFTPLCPALPPVLPRHLLLVHAHDHQEIDETHRKLRLGGRLGEGEKEGEQEGEEPVKGWKWLLTCMNLIDRPDSVAPYECPSPSLLPRPPSPSLLPCPECPPPDESAYCPPPS